MIIPHIIEHFLRTRNASAKSPLKLIFSVTIASNSEELEKYFPQARTGIRLY